MISEHFEKLKSVSDIINNAIIREFYYYNRKIISELIEDFDTLNDYEKKKYYKPLLYKKIKIEITKLKNKSDIFIFNKDEKYENYIDKINRLCNYLNIQILTEILYNNLQDLLILN